MHSIPTILTGEQLVFPDEFSFGTWQERPLRWRVLALRDGMIWALALESVAERPFHGVADQAVSWENCDLRVWLNGDFAQQAFSDQEASCLVPQPVGADENPEFDAASSVTCEAAAAIDAVDAVDADDVTGAASPVTCEAAPAADAASAGAFDRVFCPSYAQVSQLIPAEHRRALAGGNGMWWLRTHGGAPGFAAYVHNNGWINAYGYNVDEARVCVRPAVVLDLQALLAAGALGKAAGQPGAAQNVVRSSDYGEELMLEVMESGDLAQLGPFVQAFGVDESWESFLVEQLEEFAAVGDAGKIDALFDLVGAVEYASGALCAALSAGHAAATGTLIRHGARLDGHCASVPLVNNTPELRKARKDSYGADRPRYADALDGEATGHMVRVLVNQGLLPKADWRGLLAAAASRPDCQDLYRWMLCPDHDPAPGISAHWTGHRVTVVCGSSKRDVPVSAQGLRWLWHGDLCKTDPDSVRVMAPHLGFRDLDEKDRLLDLLVRNGWNRELRALLDVYRMFSINQLAAAAALAKECGRKSTADMLLTLLRTVGAGKTAREVE